MPLSKLNCLCILRERNIFHHVFLNLNFITEHFTLLCLEQLMNKEKITTLKTSIKTGNRHGGLNNCFPVGLFLNCYYFFN